MLQTGAIFMCDSKQAKVQTIIVVLCAMMLQTVTSHAQAIGDTRSLPPPPPAVGDTKSLSDLEHQGKYAEALELYKANLKQARESGQKAQEGQALRGIGIISLLMGNYDETIKNYNEALQVFRGLRMPAEEAQVLNSIGVAYGDTSQYKDALAAFEASLKIVQSTGDQATEAQVLNNMGIAYKDMGRYTEALQKYETSLKIAQQISDEPTQAQVLNNIALIRKLMGRYEEALQTYEAALKVFRARHMKAEELRALLGKGSVYAEMDKLEAALEQYQESLKVAQAIEDKGGEGWVQRSIAAADVKLGKYEEALQACQRALSISESIGDRDNTFRCYQVLGAAYRALGRKDEAIAAYQKALTHLEAMRSSVVGGEEEKITYLHAEDKAAAYQSLVELLLQQNKVDEALATLERAKSKQLIDALRLRALTVSDPNLRSLLAKTEDLEMALATQERARLAEISKPTEQQNKDKVDNLSLLVAQTRSQLLQVTNSIRAANPDYERFISVKIPDLSIIQSHLPPNVVMVEYLPLDTALVIFVVTKEGTQARSVAVSRQRIETLVAAFRAEVHAMESARGAVLATRHGENVETVRRWDWTSERSRHLRETLTTLYGYLIAPIQSDIANKETVVVVPSGALYYLPFQALAREQADKSLKFFVEEKQLAMLPSLQLWNQIINQQTVNDGTNTSSVKGGRLAAFGNPDGTLPGAKEEVQQLGSLFNNALVYVGPEATLSHIENLPKDVTMAHFATHGHLEEQDINECYLIFARGEKLKLGDVYGLAGKYPAQLTVLSACETALGQEWPGNEVAHLANGFVEAGSTTIIASLWQVSDASTAALMEEFYRQLKAGKGIAEAKRLAEITLLRNPETSHPYYWAPFILIGNWR
jgi:CHAT domain-containing protein/Flp pilus assembly protein TadD